jgi:23S rRNA pseudouridine1911/1915/1917 synthase
MSQSFQFVIGEEGAGLRVDEFLATRFGSLTRMRIASLVSAGVCLVNQNTAQAGWRLAAGDRVEFAVAEGGPTAMDPEPVALEILYEDSHLAVVVKPAGLLVHPNKSVKHGTLANALAYHLNRDFYERSGLKTEALSSDPELFTPPVALRAAPHGEAHSLVRPGMVHRLDRATSGLMVIAKTAGALSTLSRHFHRRLVKKRYLAVVHGVLGEDAVTIKARIGRDPDREPHWWVTEGGKEAETRLLVRERLDQATMVEMEPITGRTNQLRIHCAYSGFPIIGDELYYDCGMRDAECGFADLDSVISPLSFQGRNSIPKSAIRIPHPAIPQRLCLHAWRLAFHHPASGEWLEFTSPLPEDFASFIERLRRKEKKS